MIYTPALTRAQGTKVASLCIAGLQGSSQILLSVIIGFTMVLFVIMQPDRLTNSFQPLRSWEP